MSLKPWAWSWLRAILKAWQGGSVWQDELKAVGVVLVEGGIKARQGGVCGEMWLKAVSTVLVEGDIKGSARGSLERYGVNLAVYKRKVEIVI